MLFKLFFFVVDEFGVEDDVFWDDVLIFECCRFNMLDLRICFFLFEFFIVERLIFFFFVICFIVGLVNILFFIVIGGLYLLLLNFEGVICVDCWFELFVWVFIEFWDVMFEVLLFVGGDLLLVLLVVVVLLVIFNVNNVLCIFVILFCV